MSKVKPFAFVLMPFDKSFDDIYQLGIKAVCSELSIVAERVDEQFYNETMLERIYRQIENADFIIADMSGKNPNVFYEVGYAHAKKKMCALITKESGDIPFDLRHHAHIIYGGNIVDLKDGLRPRLQWMKEELERRKKETIDLSISTSYPSLEILDFRHTGEFDLQITLKNLAESRSPEIDAVSILTSSGWKVLQNGKECAHEGISVGTKKSFITPSDRRLTANGLSKIDVVMRKQFWSRWSGEEKKDSYRSKGSVTVEVATEERTLSFLFDLDLEFSDIPF
ncbi:MAG: hypothetical protein JJU40_00420 [Rhodobacteraceae bacterium]|nr:hypothetical protein [Paracoccaceae bacterium]